MLLAGREHELLLRNSKLRPPGTLPPAPTTESHFNTQDNNTIEGRVDAFIEAKVDSLFAVADLFEAEDSTTSGGEAEADPEVGPTSARTAEVGDKEDGTTTNKDEDKHLKVRTLPL